MATVAPGFYIPRVKTQYYTASSLDGFIADPDDSLEWLFPLGDLADTSYPVFIREVGALAMGSATYEWMLRHVVGATPPQPWPYRQPTWVFTTRTLPTVPGADIRFARGTSGRCTRPCARRPQAGTSGSWAAESWLVSSTIADCSTSFRPGRIGHARRRKAAPPANHHPPAAPPGVRPSGGDRVRGASL